MDIYQILRVRSDVDKAELQARYLRMLDIYQMTATFAEDQEIAKVAQMKLEQLIAIGKCHGLHNEYIESKIVETPQTDITTIKLALNSTNSDVLKLRDNNILGKINKLPESAEKHYLKAIVELRIDSTFQGCQKAVTELHAAIKHDPFNEAYKGLLDAISEQIKDYEQRQKDKMTQDEHERIERERKSQEALNEAKRRQFWRSARPCLEGIAGIGAFVGAGWCCCECCESTSCC